MINCTVRIEFDAAKRLVHFDGPCRHVHGYHYVVEASFSSPFLKNSKDLAHHSMIMDYNKLRQLLENWIRVFWDHNIILNKEDKELGEFIEKLTSQHVFYMDGDPTAERMAYFLLETIIPELIRDQKGIICDKLRIYDNKNAYIEVVLGGA